MPSPLIPQEVWLLERYSSLEYFRSVRDQWDAMVVHVEECLGIFTERLPADYRRRQLPYQPDVVWGERVLPNFRSTQQRLFNAYINLSHGDLSALGAVAGVTGDFRGMKDFSSDWMDEPQVAAVAPAAKDTYWSLISAPQTSASNIAHTFNRTWTTGDLSHEYASAFRGPLNPPDRWPRYGLKPSVRAEPDAVVPRSGIYLPDIDGSCAALLIEGKKTSRAQYLLRVDELDDSRYAQDPIVEWRSTGWTLIERMPGETVPFEEGLGPVESRPGRVSGGETCPRSGWWYTPAKPGPRQFFSKGELFPKIEGSDYGDTFWIWSADQSSPKL